MTPLLDQIQSQLNSFGMRLQELRLRRKWTLQEMADRSGLSKAFLSRLESGDRQASIAAVLTLSRIFGVSLASLFESEVEADPCVIVRRAEAVEESANGLTYVPLSKGGWSFNLQPIRVRVSRTRQGDEHFHHEGEEWIFVLVGHLTLSFAGNIYELAPGDAAHFDSRLPHRLIAKGSSDAELLLVASPPSESAAPAWAAVRERRPLRGGSLYDFSFSKDRSVKSEKPVRLPATNPNHKRKNKRSPTTTKPRKNL